MYSFEELGKYSIAVDYDLILQYCPYCFEIKSYLQSISLISKDEAMDFVEDHYKESELYRKLKSLAMHEDEIRLVLEDNANFRYDRLSQLVEECIERSIKLCDLIDYIGHYPTTWPVPKESEKNPELEKLMEEYDIIVRYWLSDDIDKMQISTNDIYRLVDTLNRNLSVIRSFLQAGNSTFLIRSMGNDSYDKELESIRSDVKVPLSDQQERGKSRRAEGLHYLRMQHGDLSQYN